MDPHHFGNLDPHPDLHPHQIKFRIRILIRIKKIDKLDTEPEPDQHQIKNQKPDPHPHQGDKSNPDPHQSDADSEHW
jgi:hypothetical protein